MQAHPCGLCSGEFTETCGMRPTSDCGGSQPLTETPITSVGASSGPTRVPCPPSAGSRQVSRLPGLPPAYSSLVSSTVVPSSLSRVCSSALGLSRHCCKNQTRPQPTVQPNIRGTFLKLRWNCVPCLKMSQSSFRWSLPTVRGRSKLPFLTTCV